MEKLKQGTRQRCRTQRSAKERNSNASIKLEKLVRFWLANPKLNQLKNLRAKTTSAYPGQEGWKLKIQISKIVITQLEL